MLFLYLVFIAHFTKFTRGSSLFMVNLCSWKNQKRKKVLGKKTRRKEERKGTTLSGKEKNPLWKRLVLAELSRWLPDFEQRSRCQSKIWRTWCWKRGYLFFMQVPALIQKRQQLPRIVILKLYVDLLSCSSAHFAGFPFLPRVFPLPLATLLVIVTSSSTLHWAIEIKKKSVWNGLLFPGNLDPSSLTPGGPIVLLSYWFAVSGGEIISWRGASCLRTFMS